MMETKVIIWSILWTTLLQATFCQSNNQNISDGSVTTVGTATEATTTIREHLNTLPFPLVLCQCGPGEVMNHTGQCQHWAGGTTVPMEPLPNEPKNIDTNRLNVTVKEAQCQHPQIDLQIGQFILRKRGDLRVMEGTFRGLRVVDYCINHQLSGDQVKVIARGCISPPVIPRCCPLGNHMINDDCTNETSISKAFIPPLSIGPHGAKGLDAAPFPWPDLQVYEESNPPCDPGYVKKKIMLDGMTAYLAALPQGVYLIRNPVEGQAQYNTFSQYCVNPSSDNQTYYAFTCERDLAAYCENSLCTNYIHKCCPKDEALSTSTKACVRSDIPFKHPFTTPDNLTTFYGFPTCDTLDFIKDTVDFTLLQEGIMIFRNDKYTFAEFCTETFLKAGNSSEPGALICYRNSIRSNIRLYIEEKVWPVCAGMSAAFLALLIMLHAYIPK
ncbi:unnamed protein product, partial [Meganyctiphanes norvegica]